MLLITGGLRSSAIGILDTHANILPIQQSIYKICYRATLRMATLPSTHPLASEIRAVFKYCKKRDFTGQKCHPSPLHKLMNEFRTNPIMMEKILPVHHFPKWNLDITISIAQKERKVIEEEEAANKTIRVYSDGLAVDGRVGVAAVLMREGRMVSEKRFHLGKIEEHIVYEAEIAEMILVVELLKETGGRKQMYTM
ncbi:uncharacterized protein HD556DRAFT_1241228 [Suillus plorans]|uniref:RNase H type-1 domain-containing protein n=1 Tax=Suillus plorans TaxID=116603 RepID=A0A9P7ALN9_9AGAM|nr:uncharacterized protein HD556DRAFT_1241228 [Suillus plorans]KAG1791018.1 hypothetical protein HD556DRAFT_1241228 [Suillus plorans]